MSIFAIGERLTVTVREILPAPSVNAKPKILCDVSEPGWTCSLQANSAVTQQVRLLRVGDVVDGWIIRKHTDNKFLAVGISDFGRFPPKPDTVAEYLDGLLAIKAILRDAERGTIAPPAPEPVAVVKGMLNRCVKKDQWDWLVVYRSFGFKDDIEAVRARDAFVRLSDICKALRKGKATGTDLTLCIERLLAGRFLRLLDAAINGLRDEHAEWEALRTPVPAKPSPIALSTAPGTMPDELVHGVGAGLPTDEGTVARSAASQVRLERANAIHQLLVQTMSSVLFAHGLQPLYNALIDLYCDVGGRFYIFEMKSLTSTNEVSQIRKAVSQLYEYRFLHRLTDAQLVIVLSRRPKEAWVVDYLIEDRSILICWLASDKFECPDSIQDALSQFCEVGPS